MVLAPYDDRTWLSLSKWNSISKCGARYLLERIEKKPSRPAAWLPRGTAAHSVIEEWEKSKRTIDPVEFYTEEAWPKALQETIDKFPDLSKWIKTPRVKSVEQDIKLREADGLKQVETYVARALAEANKWEVIEAEVAFELQFPGILVRGFIDQIRRWKADGDLLIYDLKTGGDDQETNRQLNVYSHGYEEVTGQIIEWGAYHYSKLDRDSDPIYCRQYSLEYIGQELQKIKKILDQKLLIANPSFDTCKFCGVAEFCIESKQK